MQVKDFWFERVRRVRGSFGAALSRYLLAQGVDVFDVNRFDRADRRRRGKSDPLDAENAARAVLSGRARAQAKAGDGPVEIARMYKLAKDSVVKARTQAINQLKAVLIRADQQLRGELAGLGNADLFRTCAGLADDSLNHEAGEGAVLHATHVTCASWPGASGSSERRCQCGGTGPRNTVEIMLRTPRMRVRRGDRTL